MRNASASGKNFVEFRNSIRVTRPDGSIQEIGVGRPDGISGRKAVEVVGRILDGAAMLERLNEMSSDLMALRRRADAGDLSAMYDANIQIGLVRSLRGRMDDIGVHTRFVGDGGMFFEIA